MILGNKVLLEHKVLLEPYIAHGMIQEVNAHGNTIEGNNLTDASTSDSDSEKGQEPTPERLDPTRVMEKLTPIIRSCKTRMELVTRSIAYVEEIIPEDYWVHSVADLRNPETAGPLNNYVREFGRAVPEYIPVEQHFIQHVYITALATKQLCSAHGITNPATIERVFYYTLETYMDKEVFKVIYEALRKELS